MPFAAGRNLPAVLGDAIHSYRHRLRRNIDDNRNVTRIAEVYYSKKYDNAPMPHAIFFTGGFAIHGTEYVRSLGGPASHGCVRLHPDNAALLYTLVQRYGAENTAIHIQG